MIAAGDKLDLCVSLFGEGYELINNGYLMQLDDLVEKRGQKLKQVCGVQLKGGYYQNHIYGIPTVYSEGWRYGFILPDRFDGKIWVSDRRGKILFL